MLIPDFDDCIVVTWENVLVCRECILRNSGLMRQQSASDSQMVQGENVIWTIMSLYRTSSFSLFVIFFLIQKLFLKTSTVIVAIA